MASTSAFGATQSSFSWQITGLQYTWGTNNGYSQAYVQVYYQGGPYVGASSPVYPPASSTSFNTGTGSFSGLSAGTTYTVFGYVVYNGTTQSVGSATITTASPPSDTTPPTINSVTASSTVNSITVTVSASDNVSVWYIDVYDDVQVPAKTINGSYGSVTFSGYNGGTTHTFQVIAYDTSSNYTQRTYSFTTQSAPGDTTVPTVNITGESHGSNWIAVNWNASDNVGVTKVEFYANSVFYGSTTSSTSGTYQFNNLNQNTQYTIEVRAYDAAGNQNKAFMNVFTDYVVPRPDNFAWDTAKTSGAVFNVTASEWNRLLNRINDFLTYKNLAIWDWSGGVSSGTTFYASVGAPCYNNVIDAISDLPGRTVALPPKASSGGTIYASWLNALRDSLNSVN